MVFSSLQFLFFFLPLCLLLYGFLRRRFRNIALLCISIAFYAYGEHKYLLLIGVSILLNYVFGLLVACKREEGSSPGIFSKVCLALAISANLGMLGYFKYVNFFLDNLNSSLALLHIDPVWQGFGQMVLPLGISFYTFQAMSYVIDVYRGDVQANKNPIALATYIVLFPQLIAGPIVRYSEIAREINDRSYSLDSFSEGIYRFAVGMAKKLVIADSLGWCADGIFGLDGAQINFQLAWYAVICYSLQIYFDFSGYSDMAIGLGRLWGFHFPENFSYPYASRSIREFWRRWHMTLSRWFRDYLYIPLGGNRHGHYRTFFNLLLVFVLCGFWHGAEWTFLIWGLWHGLFLALERTRFGAWMDGQSGLVQHGYTLMVLVFGWVWFRAESLDQAITFYKAMLGFSGIENVSYCLGEFSSWFHLLILLLGVICALPVMQKVHNSLVGRVWIEDATKVVVALICLFLSIANLLVGSYSPFLYFRF